MACTLENELSKIILVCSSEVHEQLGLGLLASAYPECIYYELLKSDLDVVKEKPINIKLFKMS